MPRLFVNAMSNFMIQGGVVSFTLQDQAVSTVGGQVRPLPPEDIANLVMREQDFAQLLGFLNSHVAAYEQQTGRKLGAVEGGPAQPKAPGPGGMKIRPKSS